MAPHLPDEWDHAKPDSLSEQETAELRNWAERAAHNPKTSKSRWVAQMVLRILRENYNLKVKVRK